MVPIYHHFHAAVLSYYAENGVFVASIWTKASIFKTLKFLSRRRRPEKRPKGNAADTLLNAFFVLLRPHKLGAKATNATLRAKFKDREEEQALLFF